MKQLVIVLLVAGTLSAFQKPDNNTLVKGPVEKAGSGYTFTEGPAVAPDGSLTGKTFFAPNGSDGMTIDNKGNVYLTSRKVWVYSPDGELLEEIEVPENPSNICFGGKKRNILFITARTSVYTMKMKVRGVD